jgi:hypothetical protein
MITKVNVATMEIWVTKGNDGSQGDKVTIEINVTMVTYVIMVTTAIMVTMVTKVNMGTMVTRQQWEPR